MPLSLSTTLVSKLHAGGYYETARASRWFPRDIRLPGMEKLLLDNWNKFHGGSSIFIPVYVLQDLEGCCKFVLMEGFIQRVPESWEHEGVFTERDWSILTPSYSAPYIAQCVRQRIPLANGRGIRHGREESTDEISEYHRRPRQ